MPTNITENLTELQVVSDRVLTAFAEMNFSMNIIQW